jgi:hypothetical protein
LKLPKRKKDQEEVEEAEAVRVAIEATEVKEVKGKMADVMVNLKENDLANLILESSTGAPGMVIISTAIKRGKVNQIKKERSLLNGVNLIIL